MATTTHISFSWALPVDALTFRANLEAYTNLRPILELSHLCKRSVRCPLPVDILDIIESLLLEKERTHCREKFTQLLKCHESRCEQADHFEQDIRDQIDAEPHRDSILPFASLPFHASKFTAPMHRILRSNAVPGLQDKIQEYRVACKTKHHQNVDLWQVMDVTQRGIGVLRDDFGLCARSVDYGDHADASRRQKPPAWLYRSARYTDLRARSVMYLHLPEVTNVPKCCGVYPKKSELYREFELPEYIGPTVTDWTRQPVMPETPSVQSLSRFARAIKILGLRPSSEIGGHGSFEESKQQPALTMFVVDQYSQREE